MKGLVLNVFDDRLPHDSPWRTHEVMRPNHPPLFVLDDGYPVFEVWFWHEQLRAWFCFSRVVDPAIAAAGVRYFDSILSLRGMLNARR
jgi:hypothetical protein